MYWYLTWIFHFFQSSYFSLYFNIEQKHLVYIDTFNIVLCIGTHHVLGIQKIIIPSNESKFSVEIQIPPTLKSPTCITGYFFPNLHFLFVLKFKQTLIYQLTRKRYHNSIFNCFSFVKTLKNSYTLGVQLFLSR